MIAPDVAGEWCDDLDKALRGSEMNLAGVAHRIVAVIREEAWRERRIRTGEVVRCSSFLELITAPPLKGYGEDVKRVESLIRDDPEALRMFRQATVAPKGVNRSKDGDNITIPPDPERGTSKSYTLSRLHRDRPDLYERVVAGELTANSAALEAGYRKKLTPLDGLLKSWKKATEEERLLFLASIGK